MIVLTLLMLQAVPEVPADVSSDVVVIGQRLQKGWAAKFKLGKNGMRCNVTRSTGDAEIDRIGCSALETCAPTFESRYAATNDRAIRPEVKKIMRASLNQEFTTCVMRERQAGIAALAARRKGM